MTIKTKTVKCEMCDNMQSDKSEFRAPHGHTMIVVSIWDEKEKKRRYMDFCSKECVAKWSNGGESADREGYREALQRIATSHPINDEPLATAHSLRAHKALRPDCKCGRCAPNEKGQP